MAKPTLTQYQRITMDNQEFSMPTYQYRHLKEIKTKKIQI